MDELKQKFIRTIKMYQLNGRDLPDFEIDYILNEGINQDWVDGVLKEYDIKIKKTKLIF